MPRGKKMEINVPQNLILFPTRKYGGKITVLFLSLLKFSIMSMLHFTV